MQAQALERLATGRKTLAQARIKWEYVHQTGAAYPAEIGAGYDWYMSDFYFVDGQDLPPETFGEDFEGKWGPRDSSEIKPDIGNFGTNGFYLPFNPDAPSTNYEGRASIDSAWAAGKGPANVFDGDLATAAEGTTNNETATFKLGSTLTAQKVRIYHNTIGNVFFLDADSNELFTKYVNRATSGWDDIYLGADLEIAIIAVQCTSDVVSINAIEINDDVLTDHGVIGYDASGNNNHFDDENFIPFTLTQPDTNLLTGEIEPGYHLENALDGDLTTYTRPKGSAEAQVDLAVPYTNIKTLRFYIKNESTDAILDTDCFKVNQIDYSYLVSQTARWVDIPEVDFESFSMRSNGVSSVPNIFSIEIDGVLFGQRGTANQDLVKDTPMTSYAVLETGANGNLKATASNINATYLGKAGEHYYLEADGSWLEHIGATVFKTQNTVVYNFGQQPFMSAAIKSYDPETGIVEVYGDNDSYTWSNLASADAELSYSAGPTAAFNGVLDDDLNKAFGGFGGDNGERGITIDFSAMGGVSANNSVEIYHFTNWSDGLLSVNDGQYVTNINSTGKAGFDWTSVAVPQGTTVNKIYFTYKNKDQAVSLSGVRIDGVLLVDQGVTVNPDRSLKTLFQTWAEWNDYVTLFADNPEHVAKFEAIKASLESYEGDRRDYRAELRQRLVKAGFTLPEIDTMGLFGDGEVSEEVKNQLRENASKTRSGGETRKRARNADGTFKGDDPSTPDVNEAWEDG